MPGGRIALVCGLLCAFSAVSPLGAAGVRIEDVGPDGRAEPLNSPDPSYSGSGLIAAVDGSGPVGVVGPPASWSTKNGPNWVEHVASVDQDGRLIVFYRLGEQPWKAVDLAEKTGRTVAVEEPAAWQMPEDGRLNEKLALPSPQGSLLVFSWRQGSDWRASDLTETLGHRIVGPVAAWVSYFDNRPVEHIAARGTGSELLVFYRSAGGAWAVVDVTAHTGSGLGSRVGAGPSAWVDGQVDYIAAPSPLGYLLLFSYSAEQGWKVANLTASSRRPDGPIWRIEGRVAGWSRQGSIKIAGRAPDGDLLLFSYNSIEAGWGVSNISAQAGRKVQTSPTFWHTGSGGGRVEHLAASDRNDRLIVFSRGPSGPWRAVDVGAVTGRPTTLRPTGWVTPQISPARENLASATPDGRLASFSLRPEDVWRHEDASLAASGRVVYAASQKAGVWRSDDYGRFWRQLSRPQPAEGQVVAGTLDVAVILDVAVSPVDQRIVLAGTGSDHRVESRAGLYRSADGGTTWVRKRRFVRDGEALPVSQVAFAPDDPKLVFAAGGSGISASADAGETWQEILTVEADEQVWHLAVSEADSGGRRSLAALGLARKGGRAEGRLWIAPAVGVSETTGGWQASWCRDATDVLAAGLPATNTGTTIGVGSHVMDFVPGSRMRLLVADSGHRNQRSPVYYSGDQTAFPNGELRLSTSVGSLWNVGLSACDPDGPPFDSTWEPVPLPATYVGAGASGVVYVYTRRASEGSLVFFSNTNTVHVSKGVARSAGDWHRLDGLDASRSTGGNTSLVHPDPHDLLISPDFALDLGPADAEAPFDQHAALADCGAGRLWMAHDGGVTRSSDCGASWLSAEDGLDTLNFVNVAVSTPGTEDDIRAEVPPFLYGGTTHNDQSFSADGGASWKQTRRGCGDCDAWFADPAQPSHVLRLMPRSKLFDLFVDAAGGPDARKDPDHRILFPDYARPFAISFKVLEGYRPIVYTLAGEASLAGGDYVTLKVEGTEKDGKLVAGDRVLLRARDTFTSQSGASVWREESGRAGPASVLPATVDVVQASGGHDATVFFVGDGVGVWRSERDSKGTIVRWDRIVPSTHEDPALVARDASRFFVNPYDPREVYVVSADSVRRTTDGGASWPVDRGLDGALTDGGSFLRTRRQASTGGDENRRVTTGFNAGLTLLPGESENHADEFILNDMVFDRGSRRRFAVGIAGVFFSADGRRWERLLDSKALPGRPRSAWFDAVSDPANPSLYVAYHGRGILRIYPIP